MSEARRSKSGEIPDFLGGSLRPHDDFAFPLTLTGLGAGWPIRHLAFVLEHDAGHEHMVLQILANAGQVFDDVDSKAAKCFRIADAREHQELWTIDGARGKDHFLVGRDILYGA